MQTRRVICVIVIGLNSIQAKFRTAWDNLVKGARTEKCR
jgi:hypothetical protein